VPAASGSTGGYVDLGAGKLYGVAGIAEHTCIPEGHGIFDFAAVGRQHDRWVYRMPAVAEGQRTGSCQAPLLNEWVQAVSKQALHYT